MDPSGAEGTEFSAPGTRSAGFQPASDDASAE